MGCTQKGGGKEKTSQSIAEISPWIPAPGRTDLTPSQQVLPTPAVNKVSALIRAAALPEDDLAAEDTATLDTYTALYTSKHHHRG